MRRFAKAVVAGSAVGMAPGLCVAAIFAFSDLKDGAGKEPQLFNIISFFAYGVVIPIILVLSSSILVGLPTAYVFRRFGIERLWTYGLAGLVFGATIATGFLLSLGAKNGYWLAIVGALAGTATALTWAKGNVA